MFFCDDTFHRDFPFAQSFAGPIFVASFLWFLMQRAQKASASDFSWGLQATKTNIVGFRRRSLHHKGRGGTFPRKDYVVSLVFCKCFVYI